ncbi:putative membrane protein involved in D-alanine export [Bernardetia litoralis DSM 6794]|uniref:Putative membrane protein involved in D-alanine export n=1 Tax=Bernardetia litoralis (strain ATCC 23117 / DSM 6794 / NBRC 15988 / NCIMB 1366 / Fx l1 / Sio-4) TaxID=880071 RepID=I4AQ48_BERLS|nr:MBOAT family O-acyltransferase [Bernardetia litoralis]AFM06083.1 putative membrane protein involved in D-alanine export [Bernardetia litoralis DSM 6794]
MIEFERLINHILNQFLIYTQNAPLLFNSGTFLVLFLLFYGGYIFLYKNDLLRIVYVIAFSFFFYYKSSGGFVFLLGFSAIFNYLSGFFIDSFQLKRNRKIVLWFSILINVGLLFYFKYTFFFLKNWNTITSQNIQLESIFLPIGISFFTFQAISYVVDVYKREISACRNLFDFTFYLSFFPQLVAGPIVRAKDFLPQIRQKLEFDSVTLGWGLFWILKGLFKKAVLADYLAQYVDLIYSNEAGYTGFEHLLAMYGYTIQIYCDFSGYSDMAIGLAMLMGYELCINFDRPYLATSITDFWRRWHISLSTWLKDYIYIPLGGNRHGIFRMYLALMATMLIGGFWHGADWKFIFWGAMHGVGLVVHKIYLTFISEFRKNNLVTTTIYEKIETNKVNLFKKIIIDTSSNLSNSIKNSLGWLITFHFVAFLWVFFRAESFEKAWFSIQKIFTATDFNYALPFWETRPLFITMLFVGLFIHFSSKLSYNNLGNYFASLPFWAKAICFLVVIQIILQTQSEGVQPFIYFQF